MALSRRKTTRTKTVLESGNAAFAVPPKGGDRFSSGFPPGLHPSKTKQTRLLEIGLSAREYLLSLPSLPRLRVNRFPTVHKFPVFLYVTREPHVDRPWLTGCRKEVMHVATFKISYVYTINAANQIEARQTMAEARENGTDEELFSYVSVRRMDNQGVFAQIKNQLVG